MVTAAIPYRRTVKRIDWYIIVAALLLSIAGATALFSVTEVGPDTDFRKHIVWLCAGYIGAILFALVNPEFWLKRSTWLYVICVALLLLVRHSFTGSEVGGAQRWIALGSFRFQPSEFAKLILIITLAHFFAKRSQSEAKLGAFLLSLLHVGVPFVLVFLQPDLGTALVLIGIWFGMSIVAGISWRYLFAWLVVVVILGVGAWETGVFHDYQKKRVVAFLDPSADPQKTGYQVLQARMAIGSGGTSGQGFLQGRQKEGRWIPAQHTDFIYTVIAEEGGFIGSLLLLCVYGFLLYRIWLVIIRSHLEVFRLLATGVFCLWSYHIVVNLAMVLGLFPVVGVPLPLVSYGGTATIVALCSLGLILGIRAREEKIVF